MLMTAVDPDPLACPACGSDGVVLAYSTPVYVLVKAGVAARVVVGDEEAEYARRAWCRRCGQIWHPETEPDTGTWPAWEVGW